MVMHVIEFFFFVGREEENKNTNKQTNESCVDEKEGGHISKWLRVRDQC